MNDPLSRALEETTEVIDDAPTALDEPTSHPHAVRDILEHLRAQALEAVTLPFFDGEISSDVTPISSAGRAESGTICLTAHRRDPPYRGDVTIDVRCDRESATVAARYHVLGRCIMSSANDTTGTHREFIVATELRDDGFLSMDIDQVRSEMAAAIHSMGKIEPGEKT